MRRTVSILILLAGAALGADEAAFFDKRVAPILKRRCLACHNNQLNDGNISFEDRASLLKGGPHGPAVVPGAPEKSVLIQAIQHNGEVRMPPGRKLSARDMQVLTEWIARGAVWGKTLDLSGQANRPPHPCFLPHDELFVAPHGIVGRILCGQLRKIFARLQLIDQQFQPNRDERIAGIDLRSHRA